MPTEITRRDFSCLLPALFLSPVSLSEAATVQAHNFRIRTITAGVEMAGVDGLLQAEKALAFLLKARQSFQDAGYEVQSLRIATPPLAHYFPEWQSSAAMNFVRALDSFAIDNGLSCSIGPVVTGDEYYQDFSSWALELLRSTNNTSFTVSIASADGEVHHNTMRMAAEAMSAIAHGTPGGVGNFRFAANAFTPSGTPFFPAAYFDQGNEFSIGLESSRMLTEAFSGAGSIGEAKRALSASMNERLAPVSAVAKALAAEGQWKYLGIDTSPAPGLDASIGEAIETLTGRPFGSSSTLAACAAITDVLKGLEVETCGYSGLMLPVMEDRVLAQRAAEGRYSVSELLLYSSVCGTGLDVVPLPGDTSVQAIVGLLADVAALAGKYRKPLSARLFPAPGLAAGEVVKFDNPHLTDSVVLPLN